MVRMNFRRSAFAAACAAILLTAGQGMSQVRAPATEATRFEGQTEPAAKVEVPAVVRGRLAEIVAREGQAIKAGDVIARLDTTLQVATVKLVETRAKSTTEIDYAKVARDIAKTEFDKFKANPNAFSPAEFAAKRLAYEQQEALVKKTQEAQIIEELTLERERLVLAQMTIKSPIDGYVHRLNKQAGEAIDENQPLAVVVQVAKVHANFFLGEAHFGKIKAGDKVAVELSTVPPVKREATIIAVDPYVDPAGHLFRVKMELDNSDNKIPVGIAIVWRMK